MRIRGGTMLGGLGLSPQACQFTRFRIVNLALRSGAVSIRPATFLPHFVARKFRALAAISEAHYYRLAQDACFGAKFQPATFSRGKPSHETHCLACHTDSRCRALRLRAGLAKAQPRNAPAPPQMGHRKARRPPRRTLRV